MQCFLVCVFVCVGGGALPTKRPLYAFSDQSPTLLSSAQSEVLNYSYYNGVGIEQGVRTFVQGQGQSETIKSKANLNFLDHDANT